MLVGSVVQVDLSVGDIWESLDGEQKERFLRVWDEEGVFKGW
jgi:hypothetical protein